MDGIYEIPFIWSDYGWAMDHDDGLAYSSSYAINDMPFQLFLIIPVDGVTDPYMIVDITQEDNGIKVYKIQLVQELKPPDLPNHHCFNEWVLEIIEEIPLFSTNILFSDEAHFWLNGYVNKQNYHIWAEEPLEKMQELHYHYIQTKQPFDVVSGLMESSVTISLKLRPGRT
ncbi:Hypothetical protein CINCED_3A006132 [Cinara cedri]|uniref:Uncharacterized protein n=1 Tax=Cinara cedri TaxID=506608 RepID=A0A5E4M579_9HEMI|nr:Hypothetical protein CINCED_3A006132 [Cinara cedri]